MHEVNKEDLDKQITDKVNSKLLNISSLLTKEALPPIDLQETKITKSMLFGKAVLMYLLFLLGWSVYEGIQHNYIKYEYKK